MTLIKYDEDDPRNYFPKPEKEIISPNYAQAINLLENGDFIGGHLMPWSSNNTYLVWISTEAASTCISAIYKPNVGEKPLFDFPDGDLYKREYSSYLLSKELGWPNIPITVIREGPHGVGSLQLYIDSDPRITYFEMRSDIKLKKEFEKISVFDILANNADRKAGHCIQSKNNTIWSIDHGLTFHSSFKLRTVMLEYFDQDISSDLLDELQSLYLSFNSNKMLHNTLIKQISAIEFESFIQRLEFLIKYKKLPLLDPNKNIPWPLV